MNVPRLPKCHHCGNEVVLLAGAVPPRIACTGCPYEMRGATAVAAHDNYRRRAGCGDDAYRCTRCRRETSVTFDHLGAACLCGGQIIRESTYRLLQADIGGKQCS